MHVFVYEYITGGGLLAEGLRPEGLRPEGSLLAEGAAMLSAVVEDFSQIDGVRVTFMRDARLGDGAWRVDGSCVAPPHPGPLPEGEGVIVASPDAESSTFDRLCAAADWTLVIAPELGGALLERCRRVQRCGGRLLGPAPELVALAADKHACASWLESRDVPTPQGVRLEPDERLPAEFRYPGVLKPNDGAGSVGVRLLKSCNDSIDAPRSGVARLERFHPGAPVSVAAVCGPGENLLLPPCRQLLSQDGRFHYQGSSLLEDEAQSQRARLLAERVLAALLPPRGYLGIDLVLGEDPHGAQDAVIEINPRLTSSYVLLREHTPENLAHVMLQACEG